MNNRSSHRLLKFFLLLILALSGCGPAIIVNSSTSAPAPSQTSTNTETQNPTSTSEPIHVKGKLIYYKDNTAYSLDLQTNATKVIFNTDQEQYQPILIDGSYYFSEDTGNAEYQVFKADITQPVVEQLTSSKNFIYFYDVSPDKKYLAYTEQINPAMVIFDIENKAPQVIAAETKGYKYSQPLWSPDSNKLVYFDSPDDARTERFGHLFLYTLTNKSTKELLNGEIVYVNQVAWAPNSKNIVLNRVDLQTPKQGIYILNLENDSFKLIEDNTTGSQFKWSPKGDMILYLDEQLKVFDLNNNTIEVVAKSTQDHSILDLVWSPDGKYIGYTACTWRTISSGIYQGLPTLDSCSFTIQDIVTGNHLEIDIPATYFVFWIYP